MFAEIGLPLLAAMFLDINGLIIAFMIVMFFVHEATALWDVSYATTLRTVTPIEQHVHSFLEIIPLMAIVSVVSLHWQQFLAIFGAGSDPLRTDLSWKSEPLPILYIAGILTIVFLFELLPYLEEFWRGYAPIEVGRSRTRRKSQVETGKFDRIDRAPNASLRGKVADPAKSVNASKIRRGISRQRFSRTCTRRPLEALSDSQFEVKSG
jgi:hypothetical protein